MEIGRRGAAAARAEALDQPGSKQRNGRVAQSFRVRDQVIAKAVVEAVIEGFDQAAVADVIAVQVVVDQRDTLPAQSVLHREHHIVKDQAAFDVYGAEVRVPRELGPKMM